MFSKIAYQQGNIIPTTKMCDMETDSKDHKLCRGCLSSDRRLTFVTTDHIYYSLLTEEQKQDAQSLPLIALCWECVATLRRIKKFQAQVQRSHTILQDCFGLYPVKPLLSALSTHYKWDYDAIFEERNPNEQVDTIVTPTKYKTLELEIEMEIKNDEGIKDEEIKSEYSSDDYDDHDDFDAHNTIQNLPEITIKTTKNEEKTEQPIKHLPIVKSPALIKIEEEIKLYIERKLKEKAEASEKKCNKTKKDDENKDGSGVTENEPKTKVKNVKPESDPEFDINEENDEDAPKRYFKKREDGINRRYKYRKVITRFREVADVISYFTKVEMSETDFKSVLEKEDAIVDKEKPSKCSICGLRFEWTRIMKTHAATFHKKTHPEYFTGRDFSNRPLPVPEPPCLWRCGVCGKMLREEHRVAHVDVNHRLRFYCVEEGCEWTEQFFWSAEDHQEHYTAIHKKFLCDFCGREEKKKTALETHITKVHLKRLSKSCDQCDRKYLTRNALLQHMKLKHSNDPPERRYCVECDITFPSVISLNHHFNYKHKNPGESFPCSECGKVFAKKILMQTHYNHAHKPKPTFQCTICGKCFSRKKSLPKHMDVHNNIKLPYTKPCTVCGRMFQTKVTLQNHMYTHTGERPHRCTHCDAAYTQPYCLKVHLKKQHGVDTIGKPSNPSIRDVTRQGLSTELPESASPQILEQTQSENVL